MKLARNEIELLKRVCHEYIRTKELVSSAEIIDTRSAANIQINKEFRDALSHIVRVFGDLLVDHGNKKKKENQYYTSNLDKAIGHIYRAGYDAIDGIAISLRESVNTLQQIPTSIRTQVVPDFVQKIKQLDLFHYEIGKHKENKDIGHQSIHAFNACILEINRIKDDICEIQAAIPDMLDIMREREYKNKNQRKREIIFFILGIVVSAIIGLILTISFP